jgi:surfeit locus 1 family protein
LKWRRLIGPGIAAFILFWCLIALGIWQIHRYHYKQRILAAVAHAQVEPPVPLPRQPTRFQKVAVTGTWLADRAAFYGDQIRNTPRGQVRGAQLIMPLARRDGSIVLVDLGWVKGTVPAPVPVPSGLVQVSGYVEPANRRGMFAAADDPATLIFYTLAPRRIAAAMRLRKSADFTLIMLGPKRIAGGPIPQPSLPHPPNDSLQYALTWFGLSMVLVLEFIFYARKRLAEDSSPS